MRKTLQISIIAFILLAAVLIFFNRAYRELITHSELTNRHNTVHGDFLNLSNQINNAAIFSTDLASAGNFTKKGELFYMDSSMIIQELAELKSAVRDSINIQIAGKLDTAVKSELPWIIKSNVLDSIITHKSPKHVAAFQQINFLINQGSQRTIFLVEYAKVQFYKEINKVRIWMIIFTLFLMTLLIYTTINLFRQQSKRKLKEKELENVWNRVTDAVVSVDNNWRYIFLNDAAMATHPLSKEETLGKVIWDVHPEMEGTIFWDKYHEAMQTGKVVEVESYYAPMNIWFSVKVYPSADGLTIFYKDFTEQKKLEERQELFASIVNSSDDAILSKTLDGIITSWNHGAEKIFGYSAEEIIGKHISVLIPANLHNEESQIMQKIQNGKIIDHYETVRKRKDGEIINVSLTISPIKDSLGNIIGASKISRDITERKKTQDQLIEREEQLELFIEHSPVALAMFDDEMRYIAVSKRWINDYHLEGKVLIGKTHYEIFPELPQHWKDIHQRCLQGAIEKNKEELFTSTDGTENWLQWEIHPWHKASEKIGGIIIFTEFITERKKAEEKIRNLNIELEGKVIKRTEELQIANKELESFSYSVSHDLRAPLRAVGGYAKILEEDYNDVFDVEGKRLLQEVQNNAMRMGILIDDLLAFSRLGRKEVEKSTIDMNKLVELAIWEINQTTIHNAEIKFCNLLPVIADQSLMKHVMINLISNAIKYSSKKEIPCIEIKSRQSNSELVYSISDNGAGFDMKYAHKLFGVFQRLHSADEFQGTGVGLAIVERIINKHNGRVWAEGEIDKGATFYFTLPVATNF